MGRRKCITPYTWKCVYQSQLWRILAFGRTHIRTFQIIRKAKPIQCFLFSFEIFFPSFTWKSILQMYYTHNMRESDAMKIVLPNTFFRSQTILAVVVLLADAFFYCRLPSRMPLATSCRRISIFSPIPVFYVLFWANGMNALHLFIPFVSHHNFYLVFVCCCCHLFVVFFFAVHFFNSFCYALRYLCAVYVRFMFLFWTRVDLFITTLALRISKHTF